MGCPRFFSQAERIKELERALSQETALERSCRFGEEGLFRALFENHHAAMLLIDPKTAAIIDANPAACQFYGYPKAVLTKMRPTEINTMPTEALCETMQKNLSVPSSWYAFQHQLANGDLREVEVYTGPVAFDGKRVLFSIVHDVTERQA
jgi:PAS domain S-box-containing protein